MNDQGTAQPVIWLEEEQHEVAPEVPVSDCDDIILSSNNNTDDTDLLVIEDDIELQPQPKSMRVDGRQQTITVDFHALLNSMRKTS
jgi:hypothetical protein